MHGTIRPSWLPDWSGETCAAVASGSSATPEVVDRLRGRCRVALVNNGYQLAPWADMLYASDPRWWEKHPEARKFSGIKVTAKEEPARLYGLNLVTLIGSIDTDDDRFSVEVPGAVARGGNSAFQLVNILVQAGVRRLMLVGFDFVGKHWHEDHPLPLKNPSPHTLEKWRRRFDANEPTLRSLGVDVLNVSSVSVLRSYRRATIDEALAWCR